MKDTRHFSFFQHRACEYFPCHQGVAEEDFNCLFCYCPLYALGENCGGNFKYTEDGIKDCSDCLVPHKKKNYEYIMSKFMDIVEVARKK